jgi:hypothetical protein
MRRELSFLLFQLKLELDPKKIYNRTLGRHAAAKDPKVSKDDIGLPTNMVHT